jgi:hypothetical protein
MSIPVAAQSVYDIPTPPKTLVHICTSAAVLLTNVILLMTV